jgi:hypothetical protein
MESVNVSALPNCGKKMSWPAHDIVLGYLNSSPIAVLLGAWVVISQRKMEGVNCGRCRLEKIYGRKKFGVSLR